jgi:hypothetical protein
MGRFAVVRSAFKRGKELGDIHGEIKALAVLVHAVEESINGPWKSKFDSAMSRTAKACELAQAAHEALLKKDVLCAERGKDLERQDKGLEAIKQKVDIVLRRQERKPVPPE